MALREWQYVLEQDRIASTKYGCYGVRDWRFVWLVCPRLPHRRCLVFKGREPPRQR